MRTGYITYCDDKYLGLVEVLLEGLTEFSQYPVEVYHCGDGKIHPRERVRVVKVQPLKNTVYGGFLLKAMACTMTELDAYCVLDADSVPTKDVDLLMGLAGEESKNRCPLCVRHHVPPEPNRKVMELVGVAEPGMAYCHAHFVAGKACRPFFNELLELAGEVEARGITPSNYDEDLLNVLLWKHGVTRQTNPWNPSAWYFDKIARGDWERFNRDYREAMPSFCTIHGEKRAEKARNILEWLRDADLSGEPIRVLG